MRLGSRVPNAKRMFRDRAGPGSVPLRPAGHGSAFRPVRPVLQYRYPKEVMLSRNGVGGSDSRCSMFHNAFSSLHARKEGHDGLEETPDGNVRHLGSLTPTVGTAMDPTAVQKERKKKKKKKKKKTKKGVAALDHGSPLAAQSATLSVKKKASNGPFQRRTIPVPRLRAGCIARWPLLRVGIL